MFGFTCHVDLFPVAGEPSASAGPIRGDRTSRGTCSSSSPTHPLAFRPLSPSNPHHTLPPARSAATPPSHVAHGPAFEVPRDNLHRSSTQDQDVPHQMYGLAPQSSCTRPQDEDCTMLLAGEAVVLCSLVDNDGRRKAMFVFSVRSYVLIMMSRTDHQFSSLLPGSRCAEGGPLPSPVPGLQYLWTPP